MSSLEVHCGKSHAAELIAATGDALVGPNTGSAAVVRNLTAALPPRAYGDFHAVVADRFCTSVQLALQILARNVYSVSTIQARRIGFPAAISEKRHSRSPEIERETARFAVARACPQMTAVLWYDNKPLQLLATGRSRATSSCGAFW